MKILTESDARFIERMGQLAQAEGLSRIAGQIWAVLIVSDDPVSSSELVGLLRVSKASVSTNTCFLERLGIVERRSALGERQYFFSIRPNPYTAFLEGQIKRYATAKSVVAEAKSTITNDRTRAKLADLEKFYGMYYQSLSDLLEHLNVQASEDEK
ncbi:hypothetical protein LL273_16570 [Marinobacter salarius]|jgi:DNA-binding transcriptional regulator GbsR (MarR family)|uniref:Regulatory protein, MarR n=2 Tax=Marinobacter TaxID=2742 RepID=A6EWP1_9GAMM|nr:MULTISPECIES: hypothetical protein [Marinobacter]ARM84514.1 HTH-type transcriptional regulator MmpR5 [Marinobacter salarius]EDM49428.1 regulatory protein, MarR [Marinobacter algicola DG893]MCC4285336.1 hypothetical protein [Marinobacter salarius]MCZ4285556.1 MarR family transcriptional regulator [Marinobacter salarius]MDC8457032.1 MarR family transcriptional regulator [Marinobacter sp. DS40M6]|tara:strand:- start:2082 stop:2549 length:468 start_codon:yes stop_codon:yes gene_type:complete